MPTACKETLPIGPAICTTRTSEPSTPPRESDARSAVRVACSFDQTLDVPRRYCDACDLFRWMHVGNASTVIARSSDRVATGSRSICAAGSHSPTAGSVNHLECNRASPCTAPPKEANTHNVGVGLSTRFDEEALLSWWLSDSLLSARDEDHRTEETKDPGEPDLAHGLSGAAVVDTPTFPAPRLVHLTARRLGRLQSCSVATASRMRDAAVTSLCVDGTTRKNHRKRPSWGKRL